MFLNISSEKLKKIQEYLNANKITSDALSMLQAVKILGIELKDDELKSLILTNAERRYSYELPFPTAVRDFINELIQDRKPDSILDPWSGTGLNLLNLAKTLAPKFCLGITSRKYDNDIAVLLDSQSLVQWKQGDSLTILDLINQEFDVVTSALPIGTNRVDTKITTSKGPIEIRDQIGNLVLLKSSLHLKHEGIGIFILSPSFFFESFSSVYNHLSDFGIYVNNILSIPAGSYFPLTNIDLLLIMVSKQETKDYFIGKITNDQSERSILISNLKKRKDGKEPELGMLVEPNSFQSLERSIKEKKIAITSKTLGFTAYPLAAIATVNIAKRKQDEEFEEKPNSLYLPLIGNSPAVASLDDLHIKPQNYAQIVIDPNAAVAQYVAQFYNSDLGLLIRESGLSGFIPKLSKERLLKSSIYLPDLETQREAVRTQSLISDLETQLATNKRQLSNYPRKAKEIYKVIRELTQENAFVAWIDSLPFPIASILWAYNAELDPQNKTLHLSHFFEALSELLAIISMSAFWSNKQIFEQYGSTFSENDEHKNDYQHATFGYWVTLSERLAKQIRRLLAGKETREQFLDAFGNPSDQFIEMITNKALYNSLREASFLRNEWFGMVELIVRRHGMND